MGKLFGAVFLGWALGANDAANVFGPAVASRAVRFRTAALLGALGVCVGAVTGGHRALGTLGGVSAQTAASATVIVVGAALAMTVLLLLRMPASSSQAVLGALVGTAWARHAAVDFDTVNRLVQGWVLTPVLAAAFGFALYALLERAMGRRPVGNLIGLDRTVQLGLLAAGSWGAYALGANNAANVTGVFVGSGLLDLDTAAWIAGLAIALGIVTFGRRMMDLVGRRLVRLEPPAALVAMAAQALCVHLFAVWGMPVSSSQALAGGVLGIGLAKGVRTIDGGSLLRVLLGWVATPLAGGAVAWLLAQVALP